MNLENVAASRKRPLINHDIVRAMIAFAFILLVVYYVSGMIDPFSGNPVLIVAAVFGAYMAMNIGANDVANNVGPAVGSKSLTLLGAIVVAAIFEAAGALIAGGDVVSTIKQSIINPSLIADTNTFIWVMMAALLAAAIWLNLATAYNAPVSTTHSIVGGVLGAGIAAGGPDIANWPVFGAIAASWVISPVLGGVSAAAFLYLIKRTITYQTDMVSAAQKFVPLLIAILCWAFSTYLMLKGVSKLWKIDFVTASGLAMVIALITYFLVRYRLKNSAASLENNKESVNALFAIPLICAAALLSFAHGANDVANAVGPLAAINDAVSVGGVVAKASIPVWIMLIGGLGIALGLALYGPKLIRTVGTEITELDKMRAFCVAMAAAMTVIIASQLGLPVSSTHTAVGAIFGVGFLREHLKHSYAKRIAQIRQHHEHTDPEKVEQLLQQFEAATIAQKAKILKELKANVEAPELTRKERKSLKKVYRKELVKRSHVYKIAAAWVITVPLSALMAGILYFTIRGYMLP